ncbi:iron chelate uptake ABC transporter family permease subunit [Microbacterium sp. Se63.02b]|uniref:iron chelate uptake ABC transporter family permease subunit n=1 Tax=Microbacterium sp. Se63.02b TaxID=2709304 RepID=UPI001FCF26B4|nr:iron chelate uptake ABC transporter family permease subunit [Microbacterium sp. Se63.02b]
MRWCPPSRRPSRGTAPPARRVTASTRSGRGPRRSSTGRTALVVVLALLALAIAAGVGLTVGTKIVGLDTVLRAITDFDGSDAQLVVRESRIPRTVLGIVVGLALGAAGAIMQGLTRNALADPGLLGVNAGASVAVAIAVAALGINAFPQLMAFALFGALVATIVVVLLGAVGGGSPVTLVLSGSRSPRCSRASRRPSSSSTPLPSCTCAAGSPARSRGATSRSSSSPDPRSRSASCSRSS